MEELLKKFAEGKAERIKKQVVVRKMEEQLEEAQEQAKKIRKEKAKSQQKIIALKQKLAAERMER